MRWTKTLIPTLREVPKDVEAVSHRLMLRAGYIRKLGSGLYSYLPLGMRVLHEITRIIREEMNAAGALEVLLPALHPAELWKRTGRYEALGADKIAFKNRSGQEFVLGPTHEEVITELASGYLKSYQDFPKILYQIQTKFRDELRPRFGIVRTKEFIMKDAYSFDLDRAGLDASYQLMFGAYQRIFKRAGLTVDIVSADPGIMGGDVSHEFMARSPYGEDRIAICEGCGEVTSRPELHEETKEPICIRCGKKLIFGTAMEVGHVFKLGTRYTEPFEVRYRSQDGKDYPAMMGCYGIGVNRVLAALVEEHSDAKGMCWPMAVAPYQVQLITVNHSHDESRRTAEELEGELEQAGISCLFDDRSERAGVKFNDADLIGSPVQVIIGERHLAEGRLEIKMRRDQTATLVPRREFLARIQAVLRGT